MKRYKTDKEPKEAILVNEEFLPYDTKPLDSKYRITIGGKLTKVLKGRFKVDSYQIFVGERGDILLRPAVSIPSNEAWVFSNPEVIGRIRKGLEEAHRGKTERVDDLDSFLKRL